MNEKKKLKQYSLSLSLRALCTLHHSVDVTDQKIVFLGTCRVEGITRIIVCVCAFKGKNSIGNGNKIEMFLL